MDNNIKKIFILLFVVGTLLLIIGSVSANDVELDENLEAVVVDDEVSVDNDLSMNDGDSISNLDDKVSSQATNDDETTDTISSVDDDLNEVDSKLVVSNEEQSTISAKDSNEDVLTDDTPAFTIIKTPRTSTAMVGDIITYDIFVQYNGDQPYTDWYVTVNDWFNTDELEYTYQWRINPNPDGSTWPNNFVAPEIITNQYGPHLVLRYSTWGSFQKGYCFNFSVDFRAKKAGQINNSAHIWTSGGEYWSNSSVKVGSNNFLINKTTPTPVVKVGEEVSFDIFVQNIGPQAFTDGRLVIKDLFDSDELEYVGWSTNTPYADLYHVTPYTGLIEIAYDTFNNWLSGYTLNFTLNFKTKKDGQLNNTAKIETFWGDYESSAYVLTGEPELTITKTPHQPLYQVGDDVYFDVFIENTGTLPVTNWWLHESYPENYNFMWIDDWFDSSGLEFIDLTPNAYPQNYISAGLDQWDNHHIIIQYATQGMWLPGYSLNFTTHFKALKEGQLNNSVHMFWKWKWYGDAEIHRHVEPWGNSSVYVGTPEFTLVKTSNNDTVNVGDMVTFTLNYTNTGIIPLTGVYIKDNEYTNGLVYSDYSDKDLWTFDGTDTWYYNSELAPGESAILELTFQETTAGEKNNTAIAGHNLTDDTLNSTDDVLVVENNETPEEPEEPEEDEPQGEPQEDEPQEDEPPEEEPVEKETPKGATSKTASVPAAGNPLFVLLISMISLCFVSIRSKK